MSSKAKQWLSDTVRALRARLLKDLEDEIQSVYRWSIRALDRAGLNEEKRNKRQRLEAWLDEQARASNRGQRETVEEARERHRKAAVKQVAATWLNRLVVLRQMEELRLVRTPVLTGGWNSKGFLEFRDFGPGFSLDRSEGYAFLLELIFTEHALELPGLFGRVGLVELIPMPSATLRHLVETLQASNLSAEEREGIWRDDTLLGWVYQFWNDPEPGCLEGTTTISRPAAFR